MRLGEIHKNKKPILCGTVLEDEDKIFQFDRLEVHSSQAFDRSALAESRNRTKQETLSICTRNLSELEKMTLSNEEFEDSVDRINEFTKKEVSLKKSRESQILSNSRKSNGRIVSSSLCYKPNPFKPKILKSIGEINHSKKRISSS